MTSFLEYHREVLARSGYSTEDVLVSFLPLMRQVIETHSVGNVAPLEGISRIVVNEGVPRYEEADEVAARNNDQHVDRILNAQPGGVEIIGRHRISYDVTSGDQEEVDVQADTTSDNRPHHPPGYQCWEHLVDHHDPTTDVYCLGLVLASLACGLDLTQSKDHQRFVDNRRNLFRIQETLHPVLARTIVLMTDLDRHERPQDLPALLATLENYRDQEVDFETDLASEQHATDQDPNTKRQIILNKLQERLFELNRRNRLLHFRPTLQTLNLTNASIPVSFDPAQIRSDQVLTWDSAFRKQVLSQKPVWLNQHLNFREAVYLPGQLDRLRIDARRDETEYGFAQLRIIIAFFRWADLKVDSPERYESPLLLLPARLNVRKGIHDRYSVTATDDRAEVNPVIRHLFKQLYDIDLPDAIDAGGHGIDEFFESLKDRIQQSDKAVQLARIDRPRIELIHEKAKRRLDQFQRRAGRAGGGVRRFLDLDYSYSSINYQPLGYQIFENFIVPTRTTLKAIVEDHQPAKREIVPDVGSESNGDVADDEEKTEVEAHFYNLRNELDDNPYHWEFDLCSVTLANLRYRRMSLVNDYTQLVTTNMPSPAFEASFSLNPVDQTAQDVEPVPLEDRYHVVSCDPTQSTAIAYAGLGQSYIIQGPPGTGKSQTITNLIADFVARKKRVLFVCEKRAAIDVVYHRLKQQGLDELCCLIHDSQSDKKQFVMDLKSSYESHLTQLSDSTNEGPDDRREHLTQLKSAAEPVEEFTRIMRSTVAGSSTTVRQLISLLICSRDLVPSLLPIQWERVPSFHEIHAQPELLDRFEERLLRVQSDGVLSNHPLCLLNSVVAESERPLDLVSDSVDKVLGTGPSTPGLLDRARQQLSELALPAANMATLTALNQSIDFAGRARFLADADLLGLTEPATKESRQLERSLKKLRNCDRAISKAKQATAHWKRKLTSQDTATALEQARKLDSGILRYVKPAFWKLKRLLESSYEFSAHDIRPSWTQILERLDREHEALADRYEQSTRIADELHIQMDLDSFMARLEEFVTSLQSEPAAIRGLYDNLISDSHGSRRVVALANLRSTYDELSLTLREFLENYQILSLDQLHETLQAVRDSLSEVPGFAHCLVTLAKAAPTIRRALRTLPLTLRELKAAAAHKALQEVHRVYPDAATFDHESRTRCLTKVSSHYRKLEESNADFVCDVVRNQFLDNVRTCRLPAAQLTQEQKPFKKLYNSGRRGLEHEFGKSMRYKAIRELATGETGRVLQDVKPIWLMSPLSVSETLPLESDCFDVVIFDEASQITLEEAVPSLFRAAQTIVVGDEMQLPPTSFFSNRPTDDEELSFEDQGELIQYDLNSNSFLNHAARNLPTRILGWHYRSRSESLISFSNHAFYRGRLLTVPEEAMVAGRRHELIARSAADAVSHAPELIERPVSFHFCEHGVYEKRRNTEEACYIAGLVRELLLQEDGHSIGIVAFSESQQEEIRRALRVLAEEDADFAERLESEFEREEDGQFMGLLVKNLENIQGDERDVIIMSVCYGPDPQGRIRMNFGPINMSGGEKRLNVAFSRARHHMALVASMRSTAITNDYNDGANCLKNYLRYAQEVSVGNGEAVQQVLRSLSGVAVQEQNVDSDDDSLVMELEKILREAGFMVDTNVGQSSFRCDLAVYKQGDHQYRLGILVDSDEWYQQTETLEREIMRPELLKAFGWNIEIVLAQEWYLQPQETTERLLSRLGVAENED